MAYTLTIHVNDQNGASLANVGIELHSFNSSTGVDTKINSATLITNSSGSVTFTSTDSQLASKYPLFYIQIYSGSQIIKSTGNYVTSNVVNTTQTLVLFKTGIGNNTFMLKVIDKLSSLPAPDVDVKIFSASGSETKLNSSALLTDSAGNIDYVVSDQFFVERYPNVIIEFSVNQELRFKSEVFETSNFFLKRVEFSFITSATAQTISRLVRGIVVDSNELPLSGKTIKVYQIKEGNRVFISQAVTGADGGYYVLYNHVLIAGAVNEFDLQIDVVDTDNVTVLIKSPIILNSNLEETINLIVGTKPYVGNSTFTTIDSKLRAETANLDLSVISESDIMLLSRRLDINTIEIKKWVAVQQLNDVSGLDYDVLYALLSSAGETSFANLILQGKTQLKEIVKGALRSNLIKKSGDVETVAETAADSVISYVADSLTATVNPKPDFRQLIDTVGISQSSGQTLLKELLKNEGTEADFWDRLNELVSTNRLSVADVNKFKDITVFTTLSAGSVSLTKKMLTDFSASKDPLFIKTANDWQVYFSQNNLTAPPEFVGETNVEKLASWAKYLADGVESYYPSQHLAQNIENDTQISIDYLSDFVNLNPTFDFAESPLTDSSVDVYNYPTASGFVKDSFVQTLKAIQRVYTILPKTGKVPYFKLLWNRNLHSSLSVAAMGLAEFKSITQSVSVDEQVSTEIFRNAESSTLAAFMTYLHVTHDLRDAQALGIADCNNTMSILGQLFGSQDYCQCDHCQSVYGPAAYLMDLINFCNTHNSLTGGSTPKFMELLNSRRPDITTLLLNCKNTNQEIPYLDIVNEVLEMKITPTGEAQQTEGDSEDIEAYPQKLIPAVYDQLKSGSYPWVLPFHLWNEEADAYLGMVGVTREQIAAQVPLSFSSSVNYMPDQELNMALSYLKISPKLQERIIGSQVFGNVYEDFNSEIRKSVSVIIDGLLHSMSGCSVIGFMQYTGLSYPDILDYLKSSYINGTKKNVLFNVTATSNNAEFIESCKLEDAIIPLTDEELIKLYKFVQLHRVTGWTLYELDRVLFAFGISTVDGVTNDFLKHLYYIQKLHIEYEVDITEMLTWWKPFNLNENYENVKSLYSATYGAKVNDAVINYTTSSFTTAPVMNRMAAINELTVDEFSLFVKKLLPSSLISNDIVLYQSILYGASSFSRIAGISVSEYFALTEIIGRHPVTVFNASPTFDSKIPKDSLIFLNELNQIRNSGFSIDDFIYLMSTKRPSGSKILLKEYDAVSWLGDLRTELKDIRKRYISPESEPNQNQWNSISQLFELESGSITQQVSSTSDLANLSNFITASPYLFPDSIDAKNKLTVTSHEYYLSSPFERLNYMVSQWGSHLIDKNDVDVFIKQAATLVKNHLTTLAISSLASNDTSDASSQLSFQTKFSQVLTSQKAAVQNLSQSNQPTQNEIEEYLPALLKDQVVVYSSMNDVPTGTQEEEIIPTTLLDSLKRLLQMLVKEDDAQQLYIDILTLDSDSSVSMESLRRRRDLIYQCLSSYLDAEDLCWKIVPNIIANPNLPSPLPTITARVLYTIEQLVNYLMRDALYQKLSNFSGLDYNIVQLLFEKYMKDYGQPLTKPAHYYFTYNSFVNSNSPILFYSIQGIFLEVFWKCASYVKVNQFSSFDIDYILGEIKNGTRSWLRFSHFPAKSWAFFDKPEYSRWVKLQKSTRLHLDLFRSEYSIFEMYSKETKTAVLDYLKEATGWLTSEVDESGLSSTVSLSIMTDDEWVRTVENVINLTRKTKVTYSQLKEIAKSTQGNISDISSENARLIRYSAKASFTRSTWLEQAVPIRNQLRELQRNAMVDFICKKKTIQNILFTSPEHLFEYLFIDTQMASCGRISRIKEATLAVQTMINRSLLGLLPEIKFSQENIKQWDWRRNYRVWEANRKVFLYPENYLLPELRSDKTPLYKEFEKKLKQSDLSDDSVEQIYRDYLSGLAEVANLEVCAFSGHHLQMKTPDFNVDTVPTDLHVVGRSRTNPRKYFYRKWVNQSYWEPWTELDIDIQGEQIGIVQWNRYVIITWLEFCEKALEGKTVTIKAKGDDYPVPSPDKYQEVRLGWSVFSNGAWGKRQLSKETLVWKKVGYRDDGSVYFKAPYTTTDKYRVSDSFELVSLSMETHKFISDSTTRWGNFMVKVAYHLGAPVYLPIININNNGNTNSEGIAYSINKPGALYKGSCYAVHIGEFNFSSIFEEPRIVNGYGAYLTALNNEKLKNNQVTIDQVIDNVPITPIPAGLINDSAGNFLPKHKIKLFYPLNSDCQILLASGENVSRYIPENKTAPGYYSQDPFFINDSFGSYMVTCKFSINSNRSLSNNLLGVFVKDLPSTTIVSTLSEEVQQDTANLDFYSSTDSNLIIDRASSSSSVVVSASSITPINELPSVIIDGLATEKESGNSVIQSYESYSAKIFYHPYVDEFQRVVNRYGYKELLKPSARNSSLRRQVISNDCLFTRATSSKQFRYSAGLNLESYPIMEIDFSPISAFGTYNYELFLHIPLTMAERLTALGRYDEARNWLHYIFNPTNNDAGESNGAARFWMFKPFFDLANNASNSNGDVSTTLNQYYGLVEFEAQVRNWEKNPFDPHAIAKMRIIAYMKYVYMKYLDNLIAWADSLFARDSWETIQESLQLYILAANLLGRRPEQTRKHNVTPVSVEGYLANPIDEFGNILSKTSNYIIGTNNGNGGNTNMDKSLPNFAYLTSLYFGIPQNDKLLTYWDVVADRLFKIHHCMNLEGVERKLALFEPPIDPMLLIRAKAAGLSIGAALNSINTLLPSYRFQHLLQKALEFAGEVKSLGQSFLSVLEKKDSEELGLLRNTHESRLFEIMREIKVTAVNEAQSQLEATEISAESIKLRNDHYSQLLASGLLGEETNNLIFLKSAITATEKSNENHKAAAVLAQYPDINLGVSGFGGSPIVTAMYGGSNYAAYLGATSAKFSGMASLNSTQASMSGINAGFQRREQEWQLQKDLATTELKQSEKQILAATIRLEMAKNELSQLERQIDQNKEVEAFLEDKFTSTELYGWMITRLSDVYLSAYKLAIEMARKAEKAYSFELGETNSTFINTTYWDSLYKGLLAGETLTYDLHRMDSSYTDNNKRRLELQKHVSLSLINPKALFDLKTKGHCNISLNEMMFDLDYPGQYQRRIKSISISIPAVTGPYTNVNCKLTLLNSSFRKNALLTNGVYEQSTTIEDPRFVSAGAAIQSIATSSGIKDTGMFEFNFNDSRYLPFEGAGVISNWLLELPAEIRQFDYDTISDVIIHINYTSLQDGVLKTAATNYLTAQLTQLMGLGEGMNEYHRMISLKQECTDKLYQFLNPQSGSGSSTELSITHDDFPYFIHDMSKKITSITLFVRKKVIDLNMTISINSIPATSWVAVNSATDWSSISLNMTNLELDTSASELTVSLSCNAIFPDVDDILILLNYTI